MQTVTSSRDGRFAAGEFPGLLRNLLSGLDVGRLQVTQRQVGRYIWFEHGRVRAVTSKAEEEKLGNWLVTRGLVDRQAVALALLRQPQSERLGYLLVNQGLIDQSTLKEELARLALTTAGHILFEGGAYQVDAGLRLPPDALTLDLTPTALLVAATRHTDEVGHLERLTADHRWQAETKAIEEYRDIPLLAQEGFLLSRLTRALTFEELRRLTPMQEGALMRALATLVVAGLVVPIAAVPPPREKEEEAAPKRPERGTGPGVEAFVEESWGLEEESAPIWSPWAAEPSTANEHSRPAAWRAPEPELPPAHLPAEEPAFGAPAAVPSRQGGPTMAPSAAPPFAGPSSPPPPRQPAAALDFGSNAGPVMSFDDGMHTMPQSEPEPTPVSAPVEMPSPADDAEVAPPEPSMPEVDPGELARAESNKTSAKQILDSGGDARRVVKLLQEAIDITPDPASLVTLAQLEVANPLWRQRALDHLKKAVEIAPTCTEAWLALANYWGLRGQPEKQKRCLQRILSYEPRNDAVREALNYIEKPR